MRTLIGDKQFPSTSGAVLRLLEYTPSGQIKPLINRLNLSNLLQAYTRIFARHSIRNVLRDTYYKALSVSEATALIENNLRVLVNSEIREEIIRDVLLSSSSPRTIIREIGSGCYYDGLDRIYWSLDRGEQSDIERAFDDR